MARELFRGLSNPITDSSNIDILLEQAKLNWDVCESPVTFTKPDGTPGTFPSRKVLTRCDTWEPIEVVSESFKVHQNRDIVSGLKALADAGGIKLDCGGSMDGGARVFLSGTVDRQFDASKAVPSENKHDFTDGAQAKSGARVGDIVGLRFTVSGGHRPGTPTTIKAQAMRLICTNGATVGGRECSIRITHQSKLDAESMRRLNAYMTETLEAFTKYEEKAVKLMGTVIPREVNEAFVLELLQEDILEKALRENAVVAPRNVARLTGAQILEEVMERAEQHKLSPRGLVQHVDKVGRTATEILSVVNTQPGADMTRGTLWGVYNAVTFHVDHIRGRSTDASVESAIWGEGDRLKNSALALAVDYTQRLRDLGVR